MDSIISIIMWRFFLLVFPCFLAAFGCTQVRGTEVWVSAAPTSDSATGSSADPYDGSTQEKFDALMVSFQALPDLTIHLGAGTFRSDVTADGRWVVKPGWIIEGAGMYETTCQMMGNLQGRHFDHEFFKSPSNVATDNVAIRDLTVDCNWAELELTADVGAKGEKFGAIFAISLGGSHILIERVRHLNSRGSWSNSNESFGIGLGTSSVGDGTGNIIRNCRAESPQGNYGSPFALHGWPFLEGNGPHLVTDSAVYGNYAVGRPDGLTNGFNTGGVNGAFIKNSRIYDNTFEDCQSVYYQDTGTAGGVEVSNNTLVRGWYGVAFVAAGDPAWTKTGITITGNQLNLQNRILDYGSASYGVTISGALASEVSIADNTITFTPTGLGFQQFLTISAQPMDDSTITDNTADEASAGGAIAAPVRGQTAGYGTTIKGNRFLKGRQMTGLEDGYLEPLAKAMNLSTRALIGSGENQLINGFIITGNAPKQVLLRAIGPSLSGYGVGNALRDPVLSLYDRSGNLLASNDNWKESQKASIEATGIAPVSDIESAIITTLPAGLYTTVMADKSATPGIGLVEVYDLGATDNIILQNVSTRGYVGTSEDVIIGGLIVGDGQDATFVIRAIGPELGRAGIRNPLSDPVLELHDGNGNLMSSNDNWKATQAEAIEAAGLAPGDDLDATIIETLPTGNYTTIVSGKASATGVALIEIYRIR